MAQRSSFNQSKRRGQPAPMLSAGDILFQDELLVAISKPAGLAAIPGRGESTSAFELVGAMLNLPVRGDDDPRLRLVHRLDKETSGVMLFAKDRAAQRHLSHQFQNNTVSKEYLALVAGRPAQNEGLIDAPIGVHPTDKRRMSVGKQGRPARTAWRIEEAFGDWTLLRVFPQTGKTHQIRVHLTSIGLPLAIDPLYNARGPGELKLSLFKRSYRAKGDQEERPLIARLTLHAHRLRFVHPAGHKVELAADVPKDLRAVLNMLGKYNR